MTLGSIIMDKIYRRTPPKLVTRVLPPKDVTAVMVLGSTTGLAQELLEGCTTPRSN